ncbi:hypothetical protein Tco_1400366 [Tanacetum coccineum]
MGIWYSKDTDMSLTAYSNAYHAGCQDTRRSTSGSAQFLGDKLISWSSKKQKSTVISSTEAEYISLFGCSKHIDIHYHFIKEQVKNGIVELYLVRTEYQLVDIFIKPFPRERFNFLIKKLGMKSMSPETLKHLTEDEDEKWNMNPVSAQQVALDNALVAPEKRLKIEKCNARIEFSKPQREETYQVTLDALKISPCYLAFLITTEVPENVNYVALLWEDVMFQENSREISSPPKENMPYPRFTKVIINHFISKDKTISVRNQINLHIVHDDTLLDSKAYKTYLAFATGQATPKKARKFKKISSPSKKLSHILEEEPVKKPKRAKKSAKKSTTVPTAGVVIRDTPGVSVSKKKAPANVDRGKGMDLLSDVALLKATQLKQALKKTKQETHKLYASGSGDGVGSQPKVPDESQDKITYTNEGTSIIPGVLDVPKHQSESENESWGDSEDDDSNDDVSNNDDDDVDSDVDGDNEASDSEKTNYDEDENPNLIRMMIMKKNMSKSMLKDVEHEEERKGDAEMQR